MTTTTIKVGSRAPAEVTDWDVSYIDTVIQIQEKLHGPFSDEEDRAITIHLEVAGDSDSYIAFPDSSLAFTFAMAIIEQLDDTYQDAARDSWNG